MSWSTENYFTEYYKHVFPSQQKELETGRCEEREKESDNYYRQLVVGVAVFCDAFIDVTFL